MPISVPGAGGTDRTLYGPVAVVSPTPDPDDGTAVGYVVANLPVYRNRADSTAETDLQTEAGSPIATVTPNSATGAASWLGPEGYSGIMWLADPTSGVRWPVYPSTLPPSTGGSGSTWDTLVGRPFVVAAGDTAQEARAAVGAQSVTWLPSKTDLFLDQVTNTTDAAKPVSTAQAAAITAARTAAETTSRNRQNHTGTQGPETINWTTAANLAAFRAAVIAITEDGGTVQPPLPPPPASGVPTLVDADGSTTEPYTLTLSWEPPASTGGKTVAGYNVRRDNPLWVNGTMLVAATRSFVLTNFSTGTPYKAGVQTVFADASVSAWVDAPAVTFATVVTPPTDPGTGTTTSAPMAYPTHGIGMYHMIYTRSDWPSVSTIPANVNNVRLAFWFDPGPNSSGTGSDGSAFGARLKALRARGVRIIASFGGAQNSVNMSNTTGIINSMMNFSNNVCPLDGWDIDLEGGSAPSGAQAVSIARTMRTNRGANFATTMAPNGSNIGVYIPVAQALNNAGLLSAGGQQFYDAPVDDAAMKGRLAGWVAAGLPISKYELGMMSGPSSDAPLSSYWDVATMVARLNSAKAAYPALGGAYYWESARSTASQYASQVGGIIKTW